MGQGTTVRIYLPRHQPAAGAAAPLPFAAPASEPAGPPAALRGNRLEALSGGRKGQFSVRINDQYRICFKWEAKGPTDVEITDYH